MNTEYESALARIMERGAKKTDRTGTGTTSMFGVQMRWDLALGFPLVTTKRVYTRPMIEELLWMLSGSTDNNVLRAKNVKIWDEWAREDGSLGPIYGHQWVNWGGNQIAKVIESIKTNPHDRGHIVSAWNVDDLDKMALRPCHCFFQFDVTDGKLSCQLYQRSADMFLGVPFNIASYSLLTHMVAQQCGLELGALIWTGGDCHIYDNHREQVALQMSRLPYPFPVLALRRAASIFDYKPSDVEFIDYLHHPAIKAPVAV